MDLIDIFRTFHPNAEYVLMMLLLYILIIINQIINKKYNIKKDLKYVSAYLSGIVVIYFLEYILVNIIF